MSENSEQTQSQTEVTSSEQLVGFVPVQQTDASDIGVQLVGGEGEDELYFGSQAIELNGERHVIVSQAQDPETGEILLVLQGENGDHIAIQPEALSSMVQASAEGGIQVAVVSQSDDTALAIAAADGNSLTSTQSVSDPDLTPVATTTSLAVLPSIIANIPSQTQTTTAPTNVVQAIDTPRVTAQEEQSSTLTTIPPINTSNTSKESAEESVSTPTLTPTVSETSTKKETENIPQITDQEKVSLNSVEKPSESKSEDIPKPSNEDVVSQQKSDVEEEAKVEKVEAPKPTETAIISTEPEKVVIANTPSEPTKAESDTKQSEKVDETTTAPLPSASDLGFGNTAVIQVQDSGNGTSLETLMANAMLSSDGNYVFMAQTEDGQVTSLPPDLNLSDVINAGSAGGQAFFIETPEGLVACTASASNEDGAIQLIPAATGDIDTAVINSAQNTGNSVENQIIQAISGGQTMAYTFTSNSGCLELTPVTTPQTQTSATKPARGRSGRPPKSRTISPVSSSMGQTLLLSTDNTIADGLTAKTTTPIVSTRGRGRGGGRGGRTPGHNTSVAFSPTTVSTQQQMKSSAKTVLPTTDSLKSGITGVNSLSTMDSSSPGPSQLAASRRTYSKKSNIVWITPDPSQGTTNSSFSTIAATSALSPSKGSPTKQTLSNTSNRSTSQTVSLSSQARSTSPSKAIISSTPQTNTSITSSKAIVSTPSSGKPITSTIAGKNTTAVTLNTKTTAPTTTSSKITVATTTNSKIITASKTTVATTTANKSPVQSTPTTKVVTTTAANKTTPVGKAVTNAKSTIKVSDITATKTTVSTTLPKTTTTITKPIVSTPTVTKPTTISKTVSSTIPVTKPTALTTSPTKITVSTASSNKTVASTTSVTKPVVSTTTVTKSTVSTAITTSVAKPIISSTTSPSKTVSNTRNSSKASAPTTAASKSNTSKSIVSTPTTVKAVSTSISMKSTAIESVATSNSVKNVVSKLPITETNTSETALTESSRLSPTKLNSSKIETKLSTTSNEPTNQQIVSKVKLPQTTHSTDLDHSDKSKKPSSTRSVKETNLNEKSKNTLDKPILVTNTSNDTKKSDSEAIGIEGASLLAHKSSQEIDKKVENEVKKSNQIEVNKSSRKSRRNSKNLSTVDESNKELNISATEVKDSKSKDNKKEEKTDQIAIDSDSQKVTTRRTSRKRDSSSTLNDSKTLSSDNTIIPTTPTTGVNSSVQNTSGRVTRASRTKKPEDTPSSNQSQDSKTVSTDKTVKEIPAKTEGKPLSDFDKIMEASKPQSTPEPNKTALVNSTETLTSTRSVKKKVQFEINENNEEPKLNKTDDKITKTPDPKTPVSTRRSLRSSLSTPAVENKINTIETDKKVEKEVNELLDSTNKTEVENITKAQVEISNKTPQRFSTRKRKEVPKSETLEPEVRPTKTLKKPIIKPDTSTPVDRSSVNSVKEIQSDSQSFSSGRVRRDRKPKTITRIETKIPNKEPTRHSIETSEPTQRPNRKKSFFQSYLNESDSEEKEENVRRKTISSLSDLRSPNECYDYSTNECSFYIRHQSASLTTITPKQSGGNYLCQKCGFHTSRINNLVLHHRDQCTYVKNAVIQQWQSELQKRVKPFDSSDTPTDSRPKPKKRKVEDNSEPVSTSSLEEGFDRMGEDSDEEQTTSKPDINEKPNQNPTISDIDAMLMGSDDEDLLSMDNLDNPKREFGFAEDDIVWVEAHNTHWPALVSKVHSKERKASIKFIDGPWGRKSVKTSISSISLFDSAEMNKKYLRDGRKSANGDLLVKAVQKAEEFLRKRCLGSEISAAKFFDQIDSDFSESYADDVDRVPINSTDDSSSNKNKETPNVSNDNLAETTSSPVVTNDCDNEDDKLPESNEAIAQWKEKRRLQNAKLLQCIKDGKVETHLVGVYRETIISERHQKFKSGSESEKNQLKHVPWFGPIDDEEQQEEIYDYCSQLFKTNFKTDGSFDTVAYIFEVWVPEAIVKAISRVRRIELKDSESIFAKGVILSKSEKDELTKEIQKEAEKQLISHSTSD